MMVRAGRLRWLVLVAVATAACGARQPAAVIAPTQACRPLLPAELTVSSDAGILDGIVELRLSSRASWLTMFGPHVSFTMDANVVHHRDSWAGVDGALRWTGTGPTRSWIALGAGTGTGAGASLAFLADVGVENRDIAFRLYVVRYGERAFVPGDTLSSGLQDVRRTVWDGHADGELTTRFDAGPLSVGILGGARLSDLRGQKSWISASLTVPLGSSLELQAAGGTRPDRPERGQPAGSFVRTGFAVRPRRPAPSSIPPPEPPRPPGGLEAAPLGGNDWSISIRLPSARSVYINGDITGWSALQLRRSRDDPALWAARLTVDPGVYLVTLRVDQGGWSPPPGLPVVPDGFGGQAGLLELNHRSPRSITGTSENGVRPGRRTSPLEHHPRPCGDSAGVQS
jgi:hypothetical protein